jgi:hypothetical protein
MVNGETPVSVNDVESVVLATVAVTGIGPAPWIVSDDAARPSAPVTLVGEPSVPSSGSTVNPTVTPDTGCPVASLTWTVSGVATVCPMLAVCPSPAAFWTWVGVWVTVTVAAALTDPDVAVMVAEPLPAADTRPVLVTVATPALLDDHATDGELMVAPS